MPIQLTVTDGVWLMGTELPDASEAGNDAVQEKLGEFCLAVMERHGVDVLGPGFCMDTIQ